nr:MAG TPA: hypothetical protein [Caudoviricetes sp.]
MTENQVNNILVKRDETQKFHSGSYIYILVM